MSIMNEVIINTATSPAFLQLKARPLPVRARSGKRHQPNVPAPSWASVCAQASPNESGNNTSIIRCAAGAPPLGDSDRSPASVKARGGTSLRVICWRNAGRQRSGAPLRLDRRRRRRRQRRRRLPRLYPLEQPRRARVRRRPSNRVARRRPGARLVRAPGSKRGRRQLWRRSAGDAVRGRDRERQLEARDAATLTTAAHDCLAQLSWTSY